MTNQPLTEEERLYLMINGVYLPPVEAMGAWMEDNKLILDLIEAYAAQQNAELVAQIKPLKTAEQSYCRRISSLEKDIKSLQRSAVIRDTKLAKAKAHAALMQAENEKLKAQLKEQH